MDAYLRKYLGREIMIIYFIVVTFIGVCGLYDTFVFWHNKVVAFQWSNGILSLITLVSVLLFVFKIISVSFSLATVIYSVFGNFYFIFLSGFFQGDIITHFLRDSFFVPILFVCIGLISGRAHLFISSALYYLLMVLFAFSEHSHYMFDNLFFFFMIMVGSAFGIYYFMKHLDKNLRRIDESNQAISQNNENLLKCKAELELNNDFKNHLISVISHDLRNEMGNVKMAIDFMQKNEETMTAEMRLKYDQNLSLAAERSMNMIDNFLVWAKSGKEGIVFNKETLELEKLVNAGIDQVKYRAEEKKIRIVAHDLFYFVQADYYSLLAVIRNLLHNAVKFSDKGSTITIQASQNDGHIVLQIIDQGIGISAEILEKLTNESLFVSTPGTLNEKGNGLGLPICFDFIKRNGGHIAINSKPGQGSTFSITLDKG